ncbi:MAG TPA: AzlD domain-containing protein [Acidimicrobiia bacterium]|nr:AzlD domain-containing protein [Acidimicrobiia bacterium]
MTAFLATLLVGVGTYVSRALFILVLAKKRIPDPVLVMLQFVAPAVLGALIVALLIDGDGSVAIGVPEISALAVGGFVTYKTRNHILTLVIGMVVYWVVRALV